MTIQNIKIGCMIHNQILSACLILYDYVESSYSFMNILIIKHLKLWNTRLIDRQKMISQVYCLIPTISITINDIKPIINFLVSMDS